MKVLAVEMYTISHGEVFTSHVRFSRITYTKSHTRSCYCVELVKGVKEKYLNKELNFRPQKSKISSFGLKLFRWVGPKSWKLIHDDLKIPSLSLLLKANLGNSISRTFHSNFADILSRVLAT